MTNLSDDLIYSIALQKALGFACKGIGKIIARFKSADAVFAADRKILEQSGLFSEKQLGGISAESLDYAREVASLCKNSGIKPIAVTDADYPQNLRSIADPPCVLYTLGDLPDFSQTPSISIVGSRKPTKYSSLSAFNISRKLACSGFVIISGAAVGIDSAAHLGALDAGGRTAAVLGTGLLSNYLMKQEPLRKRISQNGALITEFPPGMAVQRFSFPMRNRIISALSLGTAVIQAGEKSGSLITASFAAEQGRDVFALPGHAGETEFAGSNNLIKNGAKPIFSFSDIAEEYSGLFPGKIDLSAGELCPEKTSIPSFPSPDASEEPPRFAKKAEQKHNEPSAYKKDEINKKFTVPAPQRDLSEDAGVVYNSFCENIALFDDLVCSSGLKSDRLMCALTELEINGLVSRLSGNRFEKLS